MRLNRLGIAAVLLCACSSAVQAAQNIVVRDAWVREGPPTARVLAAYLTVANTGDAAAVLTSASSAACERVEIHQTRIEDGVARMLPQPRTTIAAGAQVSFAPGGLHLMLIAPQQALRAGQTVALRLEFEDGQSTMVTATVRKGTGQTHHHAHH